MQRYEVLIVGSGHAGAQAASELRQRGFVGSIGLVGEEAELPYERPPLSKDYLAGEKGFDRIMIRPSSFWDSRAVAMLPGRRIVAVDPDAHVIQDHNGEQLGYRRLIWATGGHARRLSCTGHDLTGVHSVRNRADVDRMKAELAGVERVAVIGGGYIGLEAASVLTKLGKAVTVIEALDRVLSRVTGPTISRFLESDHRNHGVDVRCGDGVDFIEGEAGRVAGVHLTSGARIAAEMAIVGIGIIPAVEPLLAAGAAGGNGIDVDEFGRTTLPDVFAVGDCANHENAFANGARIRLESVQNAHDMAAIVARYICGDAQPYRTLPWFWSNQFDLRLQTIGLSTGFDREVVRGNPADRSFSVIYMKEGRVLALDCVNATKDYVQAKSLILQRIKAEPEMLADPAIALKSISTLPAT